MPNISKITLPSGTTYDIKDTTARSDISSLTQRLGTLEGLEVVTFGGVTDTSLSNGSTTNPIHRDGDAASTNTTVTKGEI